MVKKYLDCIIVGNKNNKQNSGKVVRVKAGYARNLLIQKNIVYAVDKYSDCEKIAKEKIMNSIRQDYDNLKSIKEINIEKRINIHNLLYENITIAKFATYIKSKYNIYNMQIFSINSEDKQMTEIKKPGTYKISIKHGNNLITEFNLNVQEQSTNN